MERKFAPVHPQMWVDPRITKMKSESVLLLIYLMTNHHANGTGYYFFNPKYASVDLPLDSEAVERGFAELEDQNYLKYNSATHALLLMDWFKHNPMASSKNAKYFSNLVEQRRVPQGEPEMELAFFCNLFHDAMKHLSNKSFNDFFDFLQSNMERLEPGLFAQLYSEYAGPSQKDSPSSNDDDFPQGGIE